ncbi:hypothetical protein K504DRAFT_466074 [Pleomassaria siparia CBS 279.74]|uniref:Uncharacterized protein n=1 Tax=Pleomassaria siparia CBS 279.74 TaxID=1314801 RepID=A0A6G1KDW2_9PLEO|nr:hypothetical protein K504DRAFT_466074 [Pleomassaria siparia CBS 279.74]
MASKSNWNDIKMDPFSDTVKSSSTPDVGDNASKLGSGSEIDRYEAHFGEGAKRLKQAAQFKGIGSEQDRYGTHFGIEQEKVKAAALNLLAAKGAGAEQDRHESHFGLGYDGWERAKQLAAFKGTGAEQARDFWWK